MCAGIWNFEREGKLRGNWQQLPLAPAKTAFCPSLQQLCGCVAAGAAALALLCVQRRVGGVKLRRGRLPLTVGGSFQLPGGRLAHGRGSTKRATTPKPAIVLGSLLVPPIKISLDKNILLGGSLPGNLVPVSLRAVL